MSTGTGVRYARESIVEACALWLLGRPMVEITHRTGMRQANSIQHHLRKTGHFKTGPLRQSKRTLCCPTEDGRDG